MRVPRVSYYIFCSVFIYLVYVFNTSLSKIVIYNTSKFRRILVDLQQLKRSFKLVVFMVSIPHLVLYN